MSKKDDFIELFVSRTGTHPRQHHTDKTYELFCDIINDDNELRALFYEAWHEAEKEKGDPSHGLALLFDTSR